MHSRWRERLLKNQLRVNSAAFLLMVLTPVPLYVAARQASSIWVWIFLGLAVLANLLVLWGN